MQDVMADIWDDDQQIAQSPLIHWGNKKWNECLFYSEKRPLWTSLAEALKVSQDFPICAQIESETPTGPNLPGVMETRD